MHRDGWMKVIALSAAIVAGGCHGSSGAHDASPDGTTPATDASMYGDAATLDAAQAPSDADGSPDLGLPDLAPPPTACTDGTPADFPGYTALCEGTMQFYPNPVPITEGPSPYTFEFVFGSAWPGYEHDGPIESFTLPVGRYLSIPFQPSPGHTVQFSYVDTYAPDNRNIFSVSTEPGLFNNGEANGTTVLCAAKGYPNLPVTSNGTTTACVLPDMNRTYWLNMLPGNVASDGTFVPCTGMKTGPGGTTMFKCAVSVQTLVFN